MRPRLFIGCASEHLPDARALQSSLHHWCDSVIWDQNFVTPSQTTIEALESIRDFDFAAFLITATDRAESRGRHSEVTRSNVIFEVGVAVGCLGRKRTFLICAASVGTNVPSDLLGVQTLTYQDAAQNKVAAFGPVSESLHERAQLLATQTEPNFLQCRRTAIVFPKRCAVDVPWRDINESVKHRFWACGTSLTQVADRGLAPHFLSRPGAKISVRILLSATEPESMSIRQLEFYDAHPNAPAENQVQAANNAAEKIFKQINDITSCMPSSCLRRYCGLLPANITIIDDLCIACFYDETGIGENAITLCCDARNRPDLFVRFLTMFSDLWLASSPHGVSLAVITTAKDKILMYLRDDKANLPFAGCWDLLGGQVESGELPAQAIVREVFEEIELSIDAPEWFKTVPFEDRIEHMYWLVTDLNIKTTPLHEGQRLEWLSEADIQGLPDSRIAFGFKPEILNLFAHLKNR